LKLPIHVKKKTLFHRKAKPKNASYIAEAPRFLPNSRRPLLLRNIPDDSDPNTQLRKIVYIDRSCQVEARFASAIPAATKASMPMKALAQMAASVREYTTRMSPSVHRFSAALIRSAGSLNLSADAGRQWRTESPANRDGLQRRRSSIVGCRSAD